MTFTILTPQHFKKFLCIWIFFLNSPLLKDCIKWNNFWWHFTERRVIGRDEAGRRACHLKDIKAEPETPLLTVCPVLFPKHLLLLPPGHLCSLGSGMGYKIRWDAQACEVGGEVLPEEERQSRRKGWSPWRLHYKFLSPEAAPGCFQEKRQLCLGLFSSFPASPTKNGERKKIHISYKENIMWWRKKPLCSFH